MRRSASLGAAVALALATLATLWLRSRKGKVKPAESKERPIREIEEKDQSVASRELGSKKERREIEEKEEGEKEQKEKEEKELEVLFPSLLLIEIFLMLILIALLVRAGALVGQISQEQTKSHWAKLGETKSHVLARFLLGKFRAFLVSPFFL